MNIVYRDLKPSNLLVDKEGHIKLGDFGLAKENATQDNPAMSFCGTSAYLPPEVLNNSGVYKPADVYLLGVNLFEMVTGKTPFFTDDIGALYKAIINSKLKFPNGLTEEIKDLISAAMNRNPNNRPSIQKIKEHRFFKDIDWAALYRREIPPPISVDDLNKIISNEFFHSITRVPDTSLGDWLVGDRPRHRSFNFSTFFLMLFLRVLCALVLRAAPHLFLVYDKNLKVVVSLLL